ncbi:hypothetical protein QYE76_046429 [Lolium multiflorum]|uniref:Transposase (putative) gypsy type domain-containing protein n=1 Tax=Lolium multiflorum TaxID=4521 RepID=A0AAD8TNC6_LOLMU|nr:hypothetical protein QYE76_046429 [Lolium multiflorum]
MRLASLVIIPEGIDPACLQSTLFSPILLRPRRGSSSIPTDLDLLRPNQALLRVPGTVSHLLDIVSRRFASGKPFLHHVPTAFPQMPVTGEPPATSSRRRHLLHVRANEALPRRLILVSWDAPSRPRARRLLAGDHRRPPVHRHGCHLAATSSAPSSPLPHLSASRARTRSCSSPLRFRRSPSAVARSSSGARRTHAVLPPDLAVRESLAAPSPRPLHSRSFASFSASPSTVLVGDRKSAPPPANTFLSDCAAQDLHAGFKCGISVFSPTHPMSDEESSSASSSSLSVKRRRQSPGESTASDPMETDSGNQRKSGSLQESGGHLESGSFSQASGSQEASGSGQASSSSSQSSGAEPSPITRGAWMGSNVTEFEIDWLYRSRRIPEGVTCRIPGDEIEPDPKPGEHVVFLAHFERGFGLPASPFFWEFLDFYKLQPHHLPGNAIFYLSCYATFMEAYIGIRPTRETFARFFCLRINSVQGKEIPKPKPPVECGSCIVGSRQGSTFLKFSSLESCRAWQGTFFYVKNSGRANLIDLPPFQAGPPSKTNWSYHPKTDHAETNRVVRFLASLKKETNICSDDIIRTFISRRVLPLKRRAHRMSEMYGPGDPTKITGRPLSKKDVVRKAKQICQTAMRFDWEWGLLPLSTTNPPTQEAKDRFPLIEAERQETCRKRALDSFDPDPYIFWKDLKMGKTPAALLGRTPPEPTGSSDDLTTLEIHERVPPLRAEAGSEFVDKLMSQGQKNKQPASNAGPSQAPPSKRFRTEPVGEKEVGVRRYGRKAMPTLPALRSSLAQGRWALKVPQGLQPLLLAQARHHLVGNTSPPFGRNNSGRAAPSSSDHRTEEDLSFFPENQDTGASNIGAGEEEAAGRAEPPAPPVLEKMTTSTPAPSAPESSNPGDAPNAPHSPRTILMPPPGAPRTKPSGAAPTAPPPKIFKLIKGKATASSAPSVGQQPLVLHVSKAARDTATKATGLLGRITDFQRQGRDLGHLLPYAQKWNAADMTPATRGLGKDRLPAPDPVGDRSSEEHFMRLHSAVKELDSAWYDATNNLMLTADARKALFEELLWEHRELAEAHDKCQVIPEASIDALKEQLAAAQRITFLLSPDQLIRQHQEERAPTRPATRSSSPAHSAGLDHAKALKAAGDAAKMDEALEDASNATVVLRAELEELAKARKGLFPDSQKYAVKKVDARRKDQGQANLTVPWTPNDHLVALNARVSHMRAIDRNLSTFLM